MSKSLPPQPNLRQLKIQAKDLHKAFKQALPEAIQRVRDLHPRFSHTSNADLFKERFSLQDAQLVIAREYGFDSWVKLISSMDPSLRKTKPITKAHLNGIERIHNNLAVLLSQTFDDYWGNPVQVDLAFRDQTTYAEVIQAMSPFPSCTFTFSMEPLNGSAMFTMSTPMFFVLLGISEVTLRPLGGEEIEQIRLIAQRIRENLDTAWESHQIVMKNLEIETEPERIGLVAPDELVAIVGITVQPTDIARGAVNFGTPPYDHAIAICYPIATLEPILPNLLDPMDCTIRE